MLDAKGGLSLTIGISLKGGNGSKAAKVRNNPGQERGTTEKRGVSGVPSSVHKELRVEDRGNPGAGGKPVSSQGCGLGCEGQGTQQGG